MEIDCYKGILTYGQIEEIHICTSLEAWIRHAIKICQNISIFWKSLDLAKKRDVEEIQVSENYVLVVECIN
jgi:hypothetical protein